MQIGRPGAPVSHISQAHADRVEVRGRDLTGDLMPDVDQMIGWLQEELDALK